MTDAAVVGRILREYRLDPASVRRYSGSVSGTEVGYRMRQPGGDVVLVRAYRCDVLLAPPLRGCGTESIVDWLEGRAATLDWLAAQGYPAPRVVATREGDPIGVAGAWLTWATSKVTPPFSVNLIAFDVKFSSTCPNRSGSPISRGIPVAGETVNASAFWLNCDDTTWLRLRSTSSSPNSIFSSSIFSSCAILFESWPWCDRS